MGGNVREWIEDSYSPYTSNEQTNPVNSTNDNTKIKRDGSHYYKDEYKFEPTYRYAYGGHFYDYSIAMRLVLNVK